MNKILYTPSSERIQSSNMMEFIRQINKSQGLDCKSYYSLHKYSVENPKSFWKELVKFFDIDYTGDLEPVCTDLSFESYGWFPKVKLNFAKNLLKNGRDISIALSSVRESGQTQKTSYKDLKNTVAGLQDVIKPHIAKGDVLACYMPNIAETVVSMLATTSLGGVFTSTSCDFGVEGVIDRFGQSKPKVLVTVNGYEYGGKYFDLTDKINAVVKAVDSIEKVIVVDFKGKGLDASSIHKGVSWSDVVRPIEEEILYTECDFSDPLYIMYSSGTTGKPKCIVHSVGGTLVNHIKELGLHSDLKEDKSIFFFTTCGWMMWNWLVSSLYFGSTVVLYEGSPGYPTFGDFISIIEKEQLNIFGTSPKFLKALEDTGIDLSQYDMSSLETILSTGAPLLPEQFDYVYTKFKKDIQLSSISGGTDIIGCFFLGNPILPVFRGELQCAGLGMDVTCFDSRGKEVPAGEEGELVCLQSFPSRPIYFLNDDDGQRINKAYFSEFKGVWHHGDFIKITEAGGAMVLGRSDATLNPGGVRIGTAEIYRQTETIDFIEDSVCVGKNVDGDVEVWLFVVTKDGHELTKEDCKFIKTRIRENTTPRHMPRRVIQVKGIPYTRSGKKMEMAVSRLINGRALDNVQAVANPETLDFFTNL
ncbi:acetoacetate--CoA ligase [Halobacteriovorax sp. RT-1-4]|uniref:acetoacetate--CoA ligase n=1 Tax=unclassified Halobacteriovorax TaxID=2639665 RepID=UPI00399A57C8